MAISASRSLYVFAHLDGEFVPAGKLDLIEQGTQVVASSFAYGQRYLERVNAQEIDPLGLSLRDKNAVRGKLLLPTAGLNFFGGIRDAAPDAWGRRVIEARHKAPANSLPESTYLLEAGSERIGALDVRESLTTPGRYGSGSIQSLAYLMEAAERIESGLAVPERLAEIFVSGSGLGGMRPKVSVRDEQRNVWLAKFASRHDHLTDVAMIEQATLQLARRAGLNVPENRLIRVNNKSVLLIRRFDRGWTASKTAPDNPVEVRHHLISALTLLACDESDSPTKSYMDIVAAMRRYCAAPCIKADVEELYARMVFNILVSNDDDHLRNHAFLWDASAGWRLSPLYDVMPRASLATERYLHLGIGPQGRVANLDNAYAAKDRFGLLPADAARLIDQVLRTVRRWKTHFASCGVSAQQIEAIAPAFRKLDEVASAALRKRL